MQNPLSRKMNVPKCSRIELQVLAPYAHQQNGKAEHFICTLEDDIQTYFVDSGLPISFWGDALHTASYICYRLPMSMLPNGKTSYEAMHSKSLTYHISEDGGANVSWQSHLNSGPSLAQGALKAYSLDTRKDERVGLYVTSLGSITSYVTLNSMKTHLVSWAPSSLIIPQN